MSNKFVEYQYCLLAKGFTMYILYIYREGKCREDVGWQKNIFQSSPFFSLKSKRGETMKIVRKKIGNKEILDE
jgi:hypothetical protein